MKAQQLPHDPYNIIISGVGGQGNLMASRIVAGMLAVKGCYVTIGETFGMSQRGGSVMSHLRISREDAWSPQIPKGRADFIVSLEPSEAMRMVAEYGHEGVHVVTNDRPIQSMQVISGGMEYPSPETIKGFLDRFTKTNHVINATDEAIAMGNPIFTNIIIVGAAVGMGLLPVNREDFRTVMTARIKEHLVEANMKAFDKGAEMVQTVH
jgi:indolepyruvate ferredoxin oxidoreductase beta subunit